MTDTTERGYWHEDAGYWQTTGTPSPETLQDYPVGTIEVPLIPSFGYEFVNGVWVAPSQEVLDAEEDAYVRARRNGTLRRDVDRLVSNPLLWASLSQEKQDEWSTYRQALLDITQQEGFPYNVVWPTKPA